MKQAAENNDSKAEKVNIHKPSTLLNKQSVRELFAISASENIDFIESDGKCSYDWVSSNKSYHVDFAFFLPGDMDEQKSEKMYKQLTEGYLLEKDKPEQLSGLADKAIWSRLGGGQLIAKYNNEIMILNMSIIELSGMKNLGETDEKVKNDLIAKGKSIIAMAIEKLENI